jgi:hypothetical protein
MRVFLCFASEQKDRAEEIALGIRKQEHDVFFAPSSLAPTTDFDYRLRQAIQKTHLFVFLVSPESVAKGGYTLSELEFAQQRWPSPVGRVLPVYITPTPISNVPAYLRAVHILDPKGDAVAEVSAEVERLLDAVRRAARRKLLIAASIAVISVLAGAGTVAFLRGGSLLEVAEIPNLCGDGQRRMDKSIIDPTATSQLADYLDGLQRGRYGFNWGMDGSTAASQLKFNTRFATTYDEIADEVKSWRTVSMKSVADFIAGILRAERALDDDAAAGNRRLSAIIYLRAYQNFECSFPSAIMSGTPPANAVFGQIEKAYPAFFLDYTRLSFIDAYDKTIAITRAAINKSGPISGFKPIGFMREAIKQVPQ